MAGLSEETVAASEEIVAAVSEVPEGAEEAEEAVDEAEETDSSMEISKITKAPVIMGTMHCTVKLKIQFKSNRIKNKINRK